MQNEEQFEAYQADINASRNSFIDSLTEEERQKFQAVEEAVKILTDNKVFFYLFPYLPGDKGKTVWQWNSIFALTERDKNGNPTPETVKIVNDINVSTIYSFYQNFIAISEYANKSTEEQFVGFGNLLYHAIKVNTK